MKLGIESVPRATCRTCNGMITRRCEHWEGTLYVIAAQVVPCVSCRPTTRLESPVPITWRQR